VCFFLSSFQSSRVFVCFMGFSEPSVIYLFLIYHCRKDTYGVFSEPVDLDEVFFFFFYDAFSFSDLCMCFCFLIFG
jgi:hypothetical protein